MKREFKEHVVLVAALEQFCCKILFYWTEYYMSTGMYSKFWQY
jgi:hypothetical protein